MTIIFTLINIVFIIGFCYLVYRALSYMFKKFNWLNRNPILKKITFLILTIFIYTLFIYSFFYFITNPKTVDESFDKKKWIENVDSRYKMFENIKHKKILENKSKKEIMQLLGVPKNDTLKDVWYYDMGSKSEWVGWKFYDLKMEYKNGYVHRFEILENWD